jgi:hypothetical protein
MRRLNLKDVLRRCATVGVTAALAVGVGGLASGASAGATASFAITKLSPNPVTVIVNGPKKNLTIDWTGTATFPITAYYAPQPGCTTSGFTCFSGSHKFATGTHSLLWKGAAYCYGSPTLPHTGKWNVYLIDANKKRTRNVTYTVTCKA